MKTSSLRQRNENVRMFSNSKKSNDLKVFKFNNVYDFDDVTEASPNIQSMNNDHKKYDYVAPDEDCQICSIFNGYPIIFQVGSPEVRFIHYEGKTGKTINFKRIDENGDEIESGTLTELSNGFYYHVPSDLGTSIYVIHGKSYILKVPYITGSGSLSGKILLQKDKWQMIAVPKDGKIHEDFVQYLEDKYTVVGSDIFEVFNAYPATITQSSEFLSFIPGVTSPLTKHNFDMVMSDENDEQEVVGFWCKTKNYSGDELIYDWSIV